MPFWDYLKMSQSNRPDHIRLTSHPVPGAKHEFPIVWGAPTARERGPIIGTVSRPQDRNVIGTHGGSYAVYRALAVSSGALDPIRRPDLTNTLSGRDHRAVSPNGSIRSASSRSIRGGIWSRRISAPRSAKASTSGRASRSRAPVSTCPKFRPRWRRSGWCADGEFVHANGSVSVVKIAIDPVWYLPGIAQRFGTSETNLRRALFEQTAGMFPELVTRPDLQVFLPPIGGTTVYLFGDVTKLPDHRTKITCRVHDECNGSDVFGSDICTCRPYLIQGIEECARAGQTGGLGIIVYNRKEGRALGEVTKFLVYNARKRQEGGDDAAAYFERTECVAGVQDARFQQLMPDVIHWLGLKRIDRFISMSDMKYDALTGQGIEIVERVPIPDHMIPADAQCRDGRQEGGGIFFTRSQAAGPERLGGAAARKILTRPGHSL